MRERERERERVGFEGECSNLLDWFRVWNVLGDWIGHWLGVGHERFLLDWNWQLIGEE